MPHVVSPAPQSPCNRPALRRFLIASAASALLVLTTASVATAQITSVKTIFVVVMSNQDWSNVKDNSNAPYINSLLPIAASASNYFSPPGVQAALPNHLWLEAGTGFGILLDSSPIVNRQSTASHLSTLMMNAGLSWKTYQEDIDGRSCPLTSTGLYSTSDNPFVFFDDIAGNNTVCLAHVRPYSELASDLSSNTVARYNFIKPNLCNSMHQACVPTSNPVKQGDAWLSQEIPKILGSAAYQAGGALFITWDHGAFNDSPIGMIMLSPYGRKGFTNATRYTHGSTLRTFQEIFGLTNFLGGAVVETGLDDLFLPAGAAESAAVTLTWAPAQSATSYKVTRATSGQGPFSTVASGLSSTSYTDRGLVSGTTYFYSVVAVNSAGESSASPPVTVKPVLVPPTPVNVTAKQTP